MNRFQLEYIIKKQIDLENDVKEIQYKSFYRRDVDELDCTELIIALARRNLFEEVARNLCALEKCRKIKD